MMNRVQLSTAKPIICEFHRAIGGNVKRGIYDKTLKGRYSDAFVYILKGTTLYDFGDYTVTAKEGDLLFIGKGSIYSMNVQSDKYEFLYADFSFSVPEDVQLQSISLPASDGKSTENVFHKMLAVWYINRSNAKFECLSMLYNVYADFLQEAEDFIYLSSEKRRRMEKAVQYINEHFTEEDLTVAKIASAANMSESYFRKSFQETYNLAPVKYISMMRMTHARQKLRYGDVPISDIAHSLGFSSLYYFSHAFKREMGCTPSEYRSKHKQYPKT
ncbi:MAG: AraC family transcriptional regulator [Clostridia bacterium]|nr:AraC family transcriptional regulator [Clostridia bacterium]